MKISLRLIAAKIIADVMNGSSLADCLPAALEKINDSRDRAFVQALCYGVCRYFSRLELILSFLLKKPLAKKENLIQAILLIGLFQLSEMRVETYAAVNETVNAAKNLKKPWAVSLINAILREYLRHKEELDKKANAVLAGQFAHPNWLIKTIKQAWPNDWQTILLANNAHPPFVLRVNLSKISRENYLAELEKIKINAAIIPETKTGILLQTPHEVTELPGFAQGLVSVQDGAAQLAAELLLLEKSFRVLDACSAPGGKLTHILEMQADSEVIAVEKEAARLLSIKENLMRLQLTAQCICAPVEKVDAWWDGKLFDRILLDAPCSASGVIRRHPDIKLLRKASDIKPLAKLQLKILNALWPLLKPNGILVYATCSIFTAENVEVVRAFLAQHADAWEEKIAATWGVECEVGRQILPGQQQMDGFYYARLRKL